MTKNVFFALGLGLIMLVGLLFLVFQPREPFPADMSQIEAGISEVENSMGMKDQQVQPGEMRGQASVLLNPVGEYQGSGLATRLYDGQMFYHSVTADLADPPADKFYEGWLVRQDPELDFFSTGRMELVNGQYVLSYESRLDQRDYPQVVITEETLANGLDGAPEAHVLEGEF